jgi:molecular chaperone GrpE
MIEEQKPIEESPTTPAEPTTSAPAAAANPMADGANPTVVAEELTVEELVPEELVPELLETPESLDVPNNTVAAEPTGSQRDDDTDYEAAFLELRATYAAKEQECATLRADVDDRQNQYLRLAADFENFRRRTQKEKEEIEDQVKCSTVSELLSVVDNFERARSQIKPQNDAEMNIHKSYQGVYKDMVDRLKKIGVAPMRTEGEQFDPTYHNAVLREPTADHPEGTVVEELMRGYMIGDRVLRHAMVKVAAPPEDESPASEG